MASANNSLDQLFFFGTACDQGANAECAKGVFYAEGAHGTVFPTCEWQDIWPALTGCIQIDPANLIDKLVDALASGFMIV